MLKLQCPLDKCSFSFRLQTSAVILGISCFVGLCTFGVDIWHVKVINGLPFNMELVCWQTLFLCRCAEVQQWLVGLIVNWNWSFDQCIQAPLLMGPWLLHQFWVIGTIFSFRTLLDTYSLYMSWKAKLTVSSCVVSSLFHGTPMEYQAPYFDYF